MKDAAELEHTETLASEPEPQEKTEEDPVRDDIDDDDDGDDSEEDDDLDKSGILTNKQIGEW